MVQLGKSCQACNTIGDVEMGKNKTAGSPEIDLHTFRLTPLKRFYYAQQMGKIPSVVSDRLCCDGYIYRPDLCSEPGLVVYRTYGMDVGNISSADGCVYMQ